MGWDSDWRYGIEDDYNPTQPSYSPRMAGYLKSVYWAGETYWYDPSVSYRHEGNGYYYHPTTTGQWVPVQGQGREIYPRTLNTDYLEGYNAKFNEGDIVRLKTGSAPIRVGIVWGKYFTGEYISSGARVVGRPIADIVLHEDYNIETDGETKMTNTKTLYEITLPTSAYSLGVNLGSDPQTVYGHYLATNSSGQWVMEEKGTGKIHTVDKADVQEILPHTIGVQFVDGGVGKTYSYFADKGKYEVGQTFILGTSLVTVVGVDTKSKSATKDFTPTVEILTKKVG